MDSPNYLFAYGTLMSGMEAATFLAASARLVARGTMQGRLYDLGEYPAAVASAEPTDRIHGEVYELADAASLCTIDAYEGCDPAAPGSLFTRETVSVRTGEGHALSAWAYFYARPLPRDARRIRSGDYSLAKEGHLA